MSNWITNLFKTRRAKTVGVFLLFIFVTVGGLVPTGCSKNKPPDTLVVYAAGPRELAEYMCKEFEREYGIKTSLFCATHRGDHGQAKSGRISPPGPMW